MDMSVQGYEAVHLPADNKTSSSRVVLQHAYAACLLLFSRPDVWSHCR
jgi:hypothetical protein